MQAQNPAGDLQAKFNQGLALHQQGRLADAERLYDEVLRQQPNHFNALHLLGIIACQTNRTAKGVELIGRAIARDASVAAAHSNLGNALLVQKRAGEAIASYDRAIALAPDDAGAHMNRVIALLEMKRFEDALAGCDRAIALKLDHPAVHNSRGHALAGLARYPEALASYERAIALKSDYAEAHHSRGNVLIELKRHAEAVASYDRMLALRPDFANAHLNRGTALMALKRPAEALASFDRAIALRPDHAETHFERGLALSALKRPGDALAAFERALALKPDHAAAHTNRGNALTDLKRHAEALASYDRAIALNADSATAHHNRGHALRNLKRHNEALASYQQAIAVRPDFVEAQWDRSLCLLQLGRLEEGWPGYEVRKQREVAVGTRSYPQPLWLGEQDIAGKTLFVHWEQGFGDTIQFCRYARLAEARGARVVLSVQEPVARLLETLSPAIAIVGSAETPAEFDYHCPLLSLPLAFHTTLQTIPAERRYLASSEDLRAVWSARLPPRTRPRVGITWSGSSTNTSDPDRSTTLQTLLPLFGPAADWFCLQKELRDIDAPVLRQDGRAAFFGSELKDFADTAALIDLMDLVITTDTGVAHLAGALGKPVWVLLGYNPDWRWLLDRADCPWYPSARLFRPPLFGDWDSVIAQVKQELPEAFRQAEA